MSESFQTCPGCESLILSDTPSCPECGHAFKKDVIEPAAITHERSATVHQQCPKCGDDVPAGLVRCWSCNAFMRDDVAEKYQDLVDNPQKIIFSDVAPSDRTETIPPRSTQGGYARILDAGEDEFTLQDDDDQAADFELSSGSDDASSKDASTTSTEAAEPADKSETESQEKPADADEPDEPKPTEAEAPSTGDTAEDKSSDKTDAASDEAPTPQANADDLLDIALTQEKEADVRKRERRAAINRKRILIPCPSCGVWLRVREEQSGKTVRCRGCETMVPVPKIRKKARKAKEAETPQVTYDWIEDIHVHVVVPTDISLKPGSLQDNFKTADAVFADDGLHLVILGGPPKKKSLFSRGSADDIPANRKENREHIQKTGGIANLPHGELHTIPPTALNAVRLVQPVKKTHESMFAGVPVFGEGKIVVYLPVKLEDDQQIYCSLPLYPWRQFSTELTKAGVELPAKANGVPEKEIHISPLCHYTQAKVESIREVAYYQNDTSFELELTGYRCTACGIVVSEPARAKNKLGGAAGKSIAKAKCPKCSGKFGNDPLYKISRAPESVEGEDSADEAPAASPGSDA